MSIITSTTKSGGDTVTSSNNNAQRLDDLNMAGDYATAAGTANAITLSLDAQITAYTEGMIVKFKAALDNTGAVTINVNSIGAKTIKKQSGEDLIAGDIQSGDVIYLIYDGTYFQMLNPSGIGRKDIFQVTAGETIAVNEVVYYDETDNEYKLADANDTDKVRACGIAMTAGTDGNPMLIQTGGIYTAPSGTPFTAEAMNYLADTAGAVSSTPSTTTSVPIGYAMTSTTIMLTFGKKMARGTGTDRNGAGSWNETITLGFRPEHLILMGRVYCNAADLEHGTLNYINGVAAGGFAYYGTQSVDSGRIATTNLYAADAGVSASLSASSIGDKSFAISVTTVGAGSSATSIYWIAIGE